MPIILVKKPFPFSADGNHVVEVGAGEQDVSERCALVAVEHLGVASYLNQLDANGLKLDGPTIAEFVAAADELAATGTADISQRNGRYHIHSRRMERDLKTRAEREAAGSAGGNAKRDNQRASKPPSKTVANAKQDDQQEAWQKDASSYSSSVSSSEERNTPTPPHGREAWRELPIVKENPPLADALAFWLANWPSLNGGPAGDEGRIEARLAEALGRGWSVEKIVRSIRFTITRPPAKRWLDPDDDFDSRPRGKRGARESAQFIPSSEL